jgi:hypothetical protein
MSHTELPLERQCGGEVVARNLEPWYRPGRRQRGAITDWPQMGRDRR